MILPEPSDYMSRGNKQKTWYPECLKHWQDSVNCARTLVGKGENQVILGNYNTCSEARASRSSQCALLASKAKVQFCPPQFCGLEIF